MDNRRDNKRARSQKSGADTLTEVVERRAAARKHFIAEAQVVEAGSGAKLSGRSCDLVVHGCYMDTLNPFPQGTLVRVRLKHGNSRIEATGKVVYRVPSLGMGIAFNELSSEDQAILNGWLSQDGEEDVFRASLPPIQGEQSLIHLREETKIAQLIRLLRKKGILSEREEAILLNEPAELEI